MIRKNEKETIVVFGYGTVLVSNTMFEADYDNGIAISHLDKALPIGENNLEYIGKTTDELINPIRFQFEGENKIKSINVIIDHLIEIRENFKKDIDNEKI